MELEFDTSKFQLTFYARRIKKDGALATVKRLESPYFALETRILDSSIAISPSADDAGSISPLSCVVTHQKCSTRLMYYYYNIIRIVSTESPEFMSIWSPTPSLVKKLHLGRKNSPRAHRCE